MPDIQSPFTFVIALFPVVLVLAATSSGLYLLHHLLIVRFAEKGNEHLLGRQLLMLGLTITGLIVVVLALPVSDSTRNQILALIGIILSGMIAFSSTSVLSNIMAGFMLRVTMPFTTGDFVTIGDHSGRVVERGLLDTEIQTEDRQLVALPNIFVASNPVAVTHKSGAIISTHLSIGYDVDHKQVEKLLIEALENTGLNGPFVQLVSLGDFSISYKASGLLEDVKTLLSTRSELHRNILSSFHNAGVEIVSPSFMNQRALSATDKILPETDLALQADNPTVQPEEIVFDKAEYATLVAEEKQKYKEYIAKLEALLSASSTSEEKKNLKSRIAFFKQRIAQLKDSSDNNS